MAQQAKKDQEQRLIHVDRIKLIKILEKNRNSHISEYNEAMAGYKEVAIKKLQAGYNDAKIKLDKNFKKNKEDLETLTSDEIENRSDFIILVHGVEIEMRVPKSYEEEYDAAIDMTQWDIRETLELTHAEFNCFVRDRWNWKSNFEAISSIYNSKR